MSEKPYYIYCTTNKINNKKYIGQHHGPLNDDYLGSGIYITKAIAKYGKQNFSKEIIEICTEENIDEREKYWIDYYNAVEDEHYYNIMEGGQGGDRWRCAKKWMQEHPEQAKQLYEKSGKQLRHWVDTHPEEVKINIQKMLDASHNYWRTHPKELEQRMALLQQKKKEWQQTHQEEHQKQIAKWVKKGSETNSKPVICLTTNQVFDSISAAARYFNIYQSNISKVLSGERKSTGRHPETGKKLFWAWYEKKEEKILDKDS